MRVDFYQLMGEPVEATLSLIARKVLDGGGRLLAVSADEAQLDRIGEQLWTRLPGTFLANGKAGGPHDARQPILLSGAVEPANGARYIAITDGLWRDAALDFDRAFYFFDDETVKGARLAWRALGDHAGLTRHYWKQQGKRWVEAG